MITRTVTQRIIASNHNRSRRSGPKGLNCHTKNHCIKSQLMGNLWLILRNCHTKNHCIKSQHTSVLEDIAITVTQRIIASNHNAMSVIRSPQRLSHKESLHQITTAHERRQPVAVLSHKESLHQITTQHGGHQRRKDTVTQRIIASNHNITAMLATHLHTVTQRIIASNHNRLSRTSPAPRLSHKESLHQITTDKCSGKGVVYCHTKNHCIKSQLWTSAKLPRRTVTQRIIASNHNGDGEAAVNDFTVTQRIIASNHNSSRVFAFGGTTVTQRIIASNHNTLNVYSFAVLTVTQRIIASNHNAVGVAVSVPMNCHTKNHCIKSQLCASVRRAKKDCHTKNHCIKSQQSLCCRA